MATSALEEDTELVSRRQDLRRNFVVLFFHGMMGQTGFRLLQAPTFLPTYLSLLAGNNAAPGIARAVQSLGMFLSPIFSARMVERRSHAKRLGLLFGSLMRLQILFLALVALLLPSEISLPLVFVVIGVWGLATGLQSVVFNFLISKAVPAELRGRLHGTRNLASGLSLLLVSAAAGLLIDRYGFPEGYGLSFLLAFVLTSLGLASLLWMREPGSVAPQTEAAFSRRLAELPALLRSDPDFRRAIRARLLATGARGALPFYILYVGQHLELSGSRLAGLTIVFTLAQSAGSVLWGLLADRHGFRSVFLGAQASWMTATLLLLYGGSFVPLTYVVFLLLGGGVGGTMMADQNLVLEFGDERQRAMRIAATQSLAEAVGSLGFLVGGVAAELLPLGYLFLASVALQTAGGLSMLQVRDPRHLP